MSRGGGPTNQSSRRGVFEYEICIKKRVCSVEIDVPMLNLKLGSNMNPDDIEENDDVYFECEVDANPGAYKVIWKHNVSFPFGENSSEKLCIADILEACSFYLFQRSNFSVGISYNFCLLFFSFFFLFCECISLFPFNIRMSSVATALRGKSTLSSFLTRERFLCRFQPRNVLELFLSAFHPLAGNAARAIPQPRI